MKYKQENQLVIQIKDEYLPLNPQRHRIYKSDTSLLENWYLNFALD